MCVGVLRARRRSHGLGGEDGRLEPEAKGKGVIPASGRYSLLLGAGERIQSTALEAGPRVLGSVGVLVVQILEETT